MQWHRIPRNTWTLGERSKSPSTCAVCLSVHAWLSVRQTHNGASHDSFILFHKLSHDYDALKGRPSPVFSGLFSSGYIWVFPAMSASVPCSKIAVESRLYDSACNERPPLLCARVWFTYDVMTLLAIFRSCCLIDSLISAFHYWFYILVLNNFKLTFSVYLQQFYQVVLPLSALLHSLFLWPDNHNATTGIK